MRIFLFLVGFVVIALLVGRDDGKDSAVQARAFARENCRVTRDSIAEAKRVYAWRLTRADRYEEYFKRFDWTLRSKAELCVRYLARYY